MPIRIRHLARSEPINRTANTRRTAVENVGIDHRCLDVAMTQKLLDRSDVVPTLKQMGGEGIIRHRRYKMRRRMSTAYRRSEVRDQRSEDAASMSGEKRTARML